MGTYKKLIYKLLYFSGARILASIFLRHPYCSILAYHRICPLKDQDGLFKDMFTSPEIFQKQMGYLAQKHNIITLEELINALLEGKTIKKNSVVITFDDGYEDNYQYALPILKKYAFPATIFISTAYIETDRIFWWDRLAFLITNADRPKISLKFRGNTLKLNLVGFKNKVHSFEKIAAIIKGLSVLEGDELLIGLESLLNITKKANYPRMLSWGQLEEMLNQDISVGAHTHSHGALSCLSKESFEQEMVLPRRILESKLKRKIEYIAYPYGEEKYINDSSIAMTKDAGYKAGLTNNQGVIFGNDDVFRLRRIGIGGDESIEVFKMKVQGAISQLSWIKKMGKKSGYQN